MRWFKHLTNAYDDEAIAELVEKFGMEGYGIWWRVLEIIGSKMSKESDRCEATYPSRKWRSLCGVYRQSRFNSIIDFLVNHHKLVVILSPSCSDLVTILSPSCRDLVLISAASMGDLVTISCPNLLKFRDEYSKKSGQTPDKLLNDSGQTPTQDTDTDTDTEETSIEVITSIVPEAETSGTNGSKIPKKADKLPSCPHQQILELCYQILPELPRIEWTDDRASQLRTRWREKPERQCLDWWKWYFELVRECPWLMGENDRKWMADFEWLTRKKNMPKVLDGKYKIRDGLRTGQISKVSEKNLAAIKAFRETEKENAKH